MKTIEVVAAIIQDGDSYLATQRGYGEFEGLWEFPGGKIEVGETPENAIKREILEELEIEIDVDDFIYTVEYDYPLFHLTMHCYLCRIANGEMTLVEHKSAKWLRKEDLSNVEWLPADKDVIEFLKRKS